jgi:predicted RNase H-like nuclease
VDERVYEVHPEVSFRAMKGSPLGQRKKTWNGLLERVRLLADAGIHIPDELPCGTAAPDDVVDAAAAAWSAGRIACGEACTLPDGADADLRMLRKELIWY